MLADVVLPESAAGKPSLHGQGEKILDKSKARKGGGRNLRLAGVCRWLVIGDGPCTIRRQCRAPHFFSQEQLWFGLGPVGLVS